MLPTSEVGRFGIIHVACVNRFPTIASRLMSGLRLILVLSVAFGAIGTSGCAAWKLAQSSDLARAATPFEQSPQNPALSLLVVGDSTAVGVGATSSSRSVAGLVGAQNPLVQIENRARTGAKFRDIAEQLQGCRRVDLLLIQGGGNDVIRLTGERRLRVDIEQSLDLARACADKVFVMPS